MTADGFFRPLVELSADGRTRRLEGGGRSVQHRLGEGMATFFSLLSYIVVTVSSLRHWRPDALILGAIAATIVLEMAGGCARWPRRWEGIARRGHRFVPWYLGVVAVYLFWSHSRYEAGVHRASSIPIDVGTAALALVFATYGLRSRFFPGWRFLVLAQVAFLLGAWVVVAWPDPRVDVLTLQREACAQLREGINPYAASHPGIPWNPLYDGEQVRLGSGLRSFPYPPLSLLLVLPGQIVGDVRWSLLTATLVATVLLVATGRRLGLPAGHPAEIAAAAFLFHPQALSMVQCAWTEPLLVLATGLSVWAMAGRNDRVAGLALAAVVTVKQYGFFWLAPAFATVRLPRRDLLVGGLAALAIIAPFWLSDPASFWLGNVTYQQASRVRPDSLSISAVAAARTRSSLPLTLGFALTCALAAAVSRWSGPQLSRSALGGAAIFTALFFFGKAGHRNYYWFISYLLAAAIVTSLAEGEGDAVRESGEPDSRLSTPHDSR